jgi:hypothetical protein
MADDPIRTQKKVVGATAAFTEFFGRGEDPETLVSSHYGSYESLINRNG